MQHSTQNKDDDAKMLAGVPASSLLRRPPPGASILVFSQHPAALGAAEASSLDDDIPVSIGELAVRLLAEWKLPRIKALAQGRRGRNPAPASAHDPWEEET